MAKKDLVNNLSTPKRGVAAPPLWALALVIGLMVAFFWWSNHALQTERFDAVSDRLPAGFDGYQITVLSDLHGAQFGPDNVTLLERVKKTEPDMIAVTGDLLDRFQEINWAETTVFAKNLASIAPVYYVTGNHEWALGEVPKLKETLTKAGWTVLSNEYVPLERNGDTIVLAGIDDPNGYADQKTPEALTAELFAEYGHPYWLLLAHRNDRFEGQYSLLGADLTISGHGHGGIIRLPGTDGLLSTDRTFFPSYTAGFYEANGSRVFVTRGLGNSGPSFRLGNRPQVAVVTLGQG